MQQKILFENINEGDEIPSLSITFSHERNKQYCRLEHEINPLHFNADYARKLGYRDIVIAGLFTASFFPKTIKDWLGPHIFIERVQVKFENPAYINETVTYKGKVKKKLVKNKLQMIECDVWSENPQGEELARATLLAHF